MAEIREKFDLMESTRPNGKFIPQEINLHLDHKYEKNTCM